MPGSFFIVERTGKVERTRKRQHRRPAADPVWWPGPDSTTAPP